MKKTIAALAGMVIMCDGYGEVYPRLQQQSGGTKSFEVSSGAVTWTGRESADPVAVKLLDKVLKGKSLEVVVGEVSDPGMEKYRKVPKNKEGYYLNITSGKVEIVGRDGAGTYYGVQTLSQLLKDGKLPEVEITDWPDVEFRGTVEGFYGKPWGFKGRKSQIEFYGKYKLNTYIYGPKDDPFHGFSNRWRDPYPAEKAKEMQTLVNIAKENKVNFVWAVHPGKDIKWTDKDGDGLIDDFKHCLNKFELMYQLGVRSFAVFFDDIGGEGAKPEMQVKILNYLNREFVRKKKDVTPLLMCPTQYNKAWSGGPYLNTLGTKLDKDIDIMWTGNSVCCDITAESQQWINNKIKRKAYIWWNWPVSDYCRTQLLIGRTYGLDKKNKGHYGGVVSNPMDKPEASKVGLFGVADYCWNINAFDSDKAWKAGIKRLFPNLSDEIQTFANHNSDQGKSFHGYRREESAEIKPFIDRALAALKQSGSIDKADREKIRSEFVKIINASRKLHQELPAPYPAFYDEVECWIEAFEALGEAGTAAMELEYVSENSRKVALLNQILVAFDKMEAAGVRQKIKGHPDRWARECKTGTKVMTPFVEQVFKTHGAALYKSITGKTANQAATGDLYKAFSNVDSLKNISAERRGKYVNIKRVLEVISLKPGEYVGLELPPGVFANYVHLKLDNAKASTQGEVQLSTDGKSWKKERTRNKGQELQNGLNVNRKIRYMRYINTSKEKLEIKLNLFKLDVPADAKVNAKEAMFDGDLSSFFSVETSQEIESQGKEVYVIGSTDKVKVKYNDGSVVPYDNHSNKKPVKSIMIKGGKTTRIHEVIWK